MQQMNANAEKITISHYYQSIPASVAQGRCEFQLSVARCNTIPRPYKTSLSLGHTRKSKCGQAER
jgi:hypothetical protein